MEQFGFSYMGMAFLLCLLVPDLLWTRCKPGEAVLGIGHIGVHFQHRHETCGRKET